MSLLGEPRRRLREALEDGFQDFEGLNRFSMEAIEFDLRKRSSAVLGSGVEALITRMDENGDLQRLVVAARAERPRNRALREVEQLYFESFDPFGDVQAPPSLKKQIQDGGVEAVIVASAGFPSAADFTSALGVAELCVCTISYALPGGKSVFGTGLLVADDLILTNEHVIRLATTSGSPFALAGQQIVVGFDYRVPGTAPRTYALASQDWLVASSPEKRADGTNGLDYALLKLVEPVGADPVGAMTDAPPRGFLKPADARPSVNEPILILQHPYDNLDANQSPMRLTIGFILGVAPPFIQHSANSSQGSSGSPVFNSRMELIGLHHWGSPDYNRAIQIDAVKADLHKKGFSL